MLVAVPNFLVFEQVVVNVVLLLSDLLLKLMNSFVFYLQ
jgi:hypothetical protein